MDQGFPIYLDQDSFLSLDDRFVFIERIWMSSENKADLFFVAIGPILKKVRAKEVQALDHFLCGERIFVLVKHASSNRISNSSAQTAKRTSLSKRCFDLPDGAMNRHPPGTIKTPERIRMALKYVPAPY